MNTASLKLEVEEVFLLETEILDYSKKALIRMFVRRLLSLTNRTPQDPIIMSNFERSSDPATAHREEMEAHGRRLWPCPHFLRLTID